MAKPIGKKFRKLIEAAKQARKKAYCPYSQYQVGAAVLTDSGRIYVGANVENASYGLCMCAERVAIANAVVRGEKTLQAVCVVGKKARPCGACRQVMLEFSTKETTLLLVDLDPNERRDTVISTRVYSMLPNAFDPLDSGLLPQHPQNLLRRRKSAQPRRKRRPRPAKREVSR